MFYLCKFAIHCDWSKNYEAEKKRNPITTNLNTKNYISN